MAIREWSDEYASGILPIDKQHKQLFERINRFEEDMDESLSVSDAVAFLEETLALFEEHFHDEEEVMEENDFPLMDVHRVIHHVMLDDLRECMKHIQAKPDPRDKRKPLPAEEPSHSPYEQILDIAANWLHHVAKDDTIIFHYCEHRDFNLAGAIFGRTCEILSMDNKLLGYGKIDLVGSDDIEINYRHGRIPVAFNDVVKVSVVMQNQETCHFVSKVFLNKNSSVKLFRGAVIKTENDRAFYRIAVLIDGILKTKNQASTDMKILDISAGGMLIETESALDPGGEAIVEFMLEKTWFTEKCSVMRTFKKDTTLHHYGMKFDFVDGESMVNLVGQLNYLQGQRNQKL